MRARILGSLLAAAVIIFAFGVAARGQKEEKVDPRIAAYDKGPATIDDRWKH